MSPRRRIGKRWTNRVARLEAAKASDEAVESWHQRPKGVLVKVNCPCGATVEADSEDELVEQVQAHVASDHPDLVDTYTRDKILEIAERD
jgi:predicted small metal-binding protein